MQMLVKLKKLKRARKKQKWNIEKLKLNNIPLQRIVEEAIKTDSGRDVNQRWIDVKGAIWNSAQEHIDYDRKVRIRKPWITKEMISKMDERRSWKNKKQ